MSEAPLSSDYDSATRMDDEFNRHFEHRFLTVDGVQMHYVTGGTGPETIVLLHGWPQSWYGFRPILPGLLSPRRTVIAVDLPGMGDSTGELPDYRKATMAAYIRGLLVELGHDRDVDFICHDFGVGVGYALASQFPDQARSLFLMDFPLVGKNLPFTAVEPLRWHFSFNRQNPLAEQLVQGREDEFLTYFYPCESPLPEPVPRHAVMEYVRVFSRAQVLHAGFELYRTWEEDERDNVRFQAAPLNKPVHLLTQHGLADLLLPPVRDAAPEATGRSVDGAGHWLSEERPDLVIEEFERFRERS